jgi:hypothetical protein
VIEGCGEAEAVRQRRAAELTWWSAALPRLRRFPPLREFVPRQRRPRQTGWKRQLRMAELINAAFDGFDRRKGRIDR